MTTPGPAGAKHVEQAISLARNLPEAERLVIEIAQAQSRGEDPKARELTRRLAAIAPADWRAQYQLGQQAFDKVVPMLRTAKGRAELLRDGPRMLWFAVVSYVRGLYEKAKDLVATKWAEIKEIAFKVMEMLRSGAGDFGAALKELRGTLLAEAKLPTPG
jgi:hypothetical protein